MLATGQTLPDLDDDDEAESATPSALQEIGYVCDACGEEIVVPLDLSEGASQTFVEDCPVCCRANKIHVEIDPQSEIVVWAEPEQDRV
ncbi:MAG: CPXCG motif-containing cysteine-rich protein [Planctomycetes bacterium]|nr:CPXCG motif-containing cysteine-rich protein [Planctomycetota bacterium]